MFFKHIIFKHLMQQKPNFTCDIWDESVADVMMSYFSICKIVLMQWCLSFLAYMTSINLLMLSSCGHEESFLDVSF